MKLLFHKTTSWILAAITIVASLVLFVRPAGALAPAYTLEECRWPDATRITYRNDIYFAADSHAFMLSIHDWESVPAPIHFVPVSASQHADIVASSTNLPNVPWDGLTYYTCSNGVFSPSISINIEINHHYTGGYSQNESRSVTGHEIGHGLGVGGQRSGPYLMNCSTERYVQYGIDTPQPDDIQAAEAIYGHRAASPQPGRHGRTTAASHAGHNAGLRLLHVAMATPALDVSWAQSYGSLAALKAAADVVAEVQVLAATGVSHDAAGIPYTNFKVRVLEVLKGSAHPATYILHQTGAGGLQVADDPLLQTGARYIVFLHEYRPGHFFILGGPSGRYAVRHGYVDSLNQLYRTVSVPTTLEVQGMPIQTFLKRF